MRTVIAGAICVVWLVVAAAGAAVPAPSIAMLAVDIWPEHDDPRVLVIYRGTLAADTPLPYSLTLSIPADAQIHAVAYRRDAQLFSTRYETAVAGAQVRITFSLPVQDFQFEYYLDVISAPPERTFSVDVVFPLPVTSLQVSVEQPLRSSGFTLNPTPTGTSASGGFTYHQYAAQPWPAGRAWTLRGSYRKEDRAPSLAPAAPPAAAPGPPDEGSRSFSWLIPAVIGVVAGVGGALLVVYLRLGKSVRRPPVTRGTRRHGRKARHDDEMGQPRFCANCGRRAGPRDRFCSNCGRPLPG